jgi:hypothetical protein
LPYASFKLDRQRVAMAVFLKMSSIEHFRAVDRGIISTKTVRSSPETNIVRACTGSPEDRMNGMQPLHTVAHDIGKLSAAGGCT